MEFLIKTKVKEYLNSNGIKMSNDFVNELDKVVKLLLDGSIHYTMENNNRTALVPIITNCVESAWGLIDTIYSPTKHAEELMGEIELLNTRIEEILQVFDERDTHPDKLELESILRGVKVHENKVENMLSELKNNRWNFYYEPNLKSFRSITDSTTTFLNEFFPFVNDIYDKIHR